MSFYAHFVHRQFAELALSHELMRQTCEVNRKVPKKPTAVPALLIAAEENSSAGHTARSGLGGAASGSLNLKPSVLLAPTTRLRGNSGSSQSNSNCQPASAVASSCPQDRDVGPPSIDMTTVRACGPVFTSHLAAYHLQLARLCYARSQLADGTSHSLSSSTSSSVTVSAAAEAIGRAEASLGVALVASPGCVEAWALLGHLQESQPTADQVERRSNARACFERCLALVEWPPKEAHFLLIQLGQIYLDEKKVHELYMVVLKI
ncbi:unnamed protein product [Protopolystoma xenopodis]|uniref:Uncharacterized protein n=1 Tax=Protopolystoma xenopodis TaxID=117903 RepID=A0A3S5BS08_9PLAT|nr:unnamed protein product [Protopolystoma xenopodis]